MAQLITVRLNRADIHQPWGLRLQGGKDFGTPLVVQKVNMGSVADQAGLVAGDSVVKVNNVDVFNLRHKDAQDVIVRSGNSFEVTVQRGGTTWRPNVTPTGVIPSPTPSYTSTHVNTVTKTSLAHKQQEIQHIGTGYNNAARPFNAHNGYDPSVKSIVNKQYNTPVGIYSEESIAETLSAQAEVLAGGVLGVNFKKNEKVYNSAGSEVLKALQESENEPAEPAMKNYFWTASHAVGSAASSRTQTPSCFAKFQDDDKMGGRNYAPAPPVLSGPDSIPQPDDMNVQQKNGANAPPCDECGASIVGVFVRIKDKNLHVECFRCATCGTTLKNQGYFNLNNKLYCDIHAKLAAMQHPPPGTEGFKPVPIQPNTKLSANTISAALDAHYNGTSNLNSNLAGPKPFAYGSGPPQAGPKSPSMYQPSRPQVNWNKPPGQVQQPYGGPIQNYSTPPQNYGSNTLPRSVGGGQNIPVPPPLPLTIPPTGKTMQIEENDCKPGYATEMLEQSLLKLKASEKEEFRSNAGKVISLMLESRLNDKDLMSDSKSKNPHNSNNKITDLAEKVFAQSKDSPLTKTPNESNKNFSSPIKIPSNNAAISLKPNTNGTNGTCQTIQQFAATPPTPPPPPPTPFDTVPQTPFDTLPPPPPPPNFNQLLINNNIVPPKSMSPPIEPTQAAANEVNGQNSVVFRNKDNKSKLTTHARDRRSYIERDQQQPMNGPLSSDTTDKASELTEGKKPVCNVCNTKITQGPFITALGRIWCPDHFVCVTSNCRRPLQDIGFVEEKGELYCEFCFEKYLAPPCDRCGAKIKGDCLNAIGKHFHPECFKCTYCGKLFGNSPFFLEDGQPYCEADWNEMFTTKCFACGFPIESGDRWVEALSHNYHSQCFNCTTCKKNLEGQSFFAKGGRPFCKNHVR